MLKTEKRASQNPEKTCFPNTQLQRKCLRVFPESCGLYRMLILRTTIFSRFSPALDYSRKNPP